MTIYDIAQKAGVSASTVSRVMNNKSGVGEATRKRIKELLAESGYMPNEMARGLANQSNKTIGILVSDVRAAHHTDGAYYIERELTAKGYCCFIFNTGHDESDKTKYIRTLSTRKVEGVVMIGSTYQCEEVREAIETHLPDIPVVMVHGQFDLPNTYSVMCDTMYGVKKCVQLLAGEGHDKIAYIYDLPTPSNKQKEQGYLSAMAELGRGDCVWCYEAGADWQCGYDCTSRLLREHPDVNGIMYAVDLLAVSGINALRDRNIEIPDQIAVIGVDNSLYGQICIPKLTSLDNKLTESCIEAARILISCLENGGTAKIRELYSSIIIRETT